MSAALSYPERIDTHFGWPLGTASRLARRGKLPYYVLPDGSIRLNLEEVQRLVRHIPLPAQEKEECHVV